MPASLAFINLFIISPVCIKGNAWLMTYLCESACRTMTRFLPSQNHVLFMTTYVGHCCLGNLHGFNPNCFIKNILYDDNS